MLHTLAVALGYTLMAAGAFIGLIVIDCRNASRIAGTTAVIVTIAAFGVAILH